MMFFSWFGATQFGAQTYRLIRVIFGLLTSDLNCDILSASQELGGKQTEPPSYRKEEVMSNMDSSNKPSAVASLLNK